MSRHFPSKRHRMSVSSIFCHFYWAYAIYDECNESKIAIRRRNRDKTIQKHTFEAFRRNDVNYIPMSSIRNFIP